MHLSRNRPAVQVKPGTLNSGGTQETQGAQGGEAATKREPWKDTID
jgi:hypothetical protein